MFLEGLIIIVFCVHFAHSLLEGSFKGSSLLLAANLTLAAAWCVF